MSTWPPAQTQCPIARTLDRTGDGWSLMILRDASQGLTRFDEFEKSLGIAPNILSKRLTGLVEAGLLERRLYSTRPPRYEYVPTPIGRDFQPVLIAMMAFGNRHFATEGVASHWIDAATGQDAEPVVVDRHTGRPMDDGSFLYVAGPAAKPDVLRRVAEIEARRVGS
jgi:DNA-binding HxlR family transcriptional regulator